MDVEKMQRIEEGLRRNQFKVSQQAIEILKFLFEIYGIENGFKIPYIQFGRFIISCGSSIMNDSFSIQVFELALYSLTAYSQYSTISVNFEFDTVVSVFPNPSIYLSQCNWKIVDSLDIQQDRVAVSLSFLQKLVSMRGFLIAILVSRRPKPKLYLPHELWEWINNEFL